ncbi:MAG: sodium:proton antiporter [Ardenticatenaceae bacterium]|nr:sodium:proton antiporter [Ardenticatenaceae bacterium]
MSEHLLVNLASILILGIGAQWLAWRLRLPSILLLLLFGFLAGPITGFLHPDHLFGEMLFPVVSISVAVILFEGGLTLRLSELPRAGRAIFRLISVGALVTWGITAVSAHYILQMDWSLSVLLGAILIVTGPTVIGPLLRQIRPKGNTGAILKWEGILIDPVGAVLAVLVFEAILSGQFDQAPAVIIGGVLQTLVIGVVLGVLGAAIMIVLLRRYWVPDHLQNGIALLLASAMFALSNELHPEAGLLTVTLMGILLANQKWVSIKHIVEFKENLRVLLIGALFIILAARIELTDLVALGWKGLIFQIVLVVAARPLTVLLSTWGTRINLKEKLFLSWMAPRGIVAASVASIFAFELVEAGHDGAQLLVTATFLVIVSTVSLYGLTAGPLALRLGLSEQNPQGVLFVGAHNLARAIAAALQKQGFRTLLLDTNPKNVELSQEAGLQACLGDAISEELMDELDLTGIGRSLALTSNSDVNSLAALHFTELFGRAEVYQLPVKSDSEPHEEASHPLRGRILFGRHKTFAFLMEQLANQFVIAAAKLTDTFDYVAFQTKYGSQAIPLFLITENKQLIVYTTDYQPIPKPGQTLISIVLLGKWLLQRRGVPPNKSLYRR